MTSGDTDRSDASPQSSALKIHLGLFGGTFNPIHNGHLSIARQTQGALGLDRILFIPTGDPPHKSDTNLAPVKDRYEMVRLAVTSEPGFAVSDVEIRRPGKSYSVDTVRTLQKEYGPHARLSFLIGLDAFLDVPSWRDPVTLLRLCSFIVISRPGTLFQSLSQLTLLPPLPREALTDLDASRITKLEIPVGDQRLTCLRLPPCNISASDIRARVAHRDSLVNLLPPPVESYILHHHLYE